MKKETNKEVKKPILSVRKGTTKASVWCNENKDGDKSYSITLQKSYKPKDSEEWQHKTINLFMSEIQDVISVLLEVERQNLEITE